NWIVRRGYVLPPESGKLADYRAKYYLAWRVGLGRTVGSWMSPNPSTLLNLARFGSDHADSLLRDLRDGTLSRDFEWPESVRQAIRSQLAPQPQRVRQLEGILNQTGGLRPRDVWPELKLLGCWTGGSMGTYLRSFPEFFGDAAVRDLGLLASEGRMTFPLADGTPAGVLEIVSNFFEFIPVSEIDSPQPTILEAHELQEGGEYFILLTNASGLYRYNIHDVVRCTGFQERTPLLEFLNKGSGFCSVTGEKLTDYQVATAMAQTLSERKLSVSAFALAPVWDDPDLPSYSLFIEDGELGDLAGFAESMDRKLHELNIEYASKRSSQRLGPIHVVTKPRGFWDQWDHQRLQKSGGTVEQYKRPALLQQPPRLD
ncbi:MAG TPA: GH3 auxin-responsive promoter family protein, partial [Planctomycetaceae bacterium]|nr:GH3 auxin-responsive promoter family protein [Planctomycetaceae bacterium]